MPGLANLYSGEEAIAVGVCAALEETDYITSTHRGHGPTSADCGAEPQPCDPRAMSSVPGSTGT